MIEISMDDVVRRLAFDNPWWDPANSSRPYGSLPERAYFRLFKELVSNRAVRRAIVLMGPRRVGKTVMLHQMIYQLIAAGHPANSLMFLSLETPIYIGIGLEKFVQLFIDRFKHETTGSLTVFFDEIQYLGGWELHLKSLVDSFPSIRFVASGSAAAALRLKSQESGAGRFTDFLLPPLTFAEYLKFIDKEKSLIREVYGGEHVKYEAVDIEALNRELIEYLNFGGYPEAVFNETIRRQSAQFIKSDIIDKVLLRDLPQLYGIRDIQELNRLFTTLAYNTGNEVSLEGLSKSSGVSKATLMRYLEYLEAAFLIRRVFRIDQNAKRFQRATSFKVYLTNPTMRAALFGTLETDDKSMGALAETALFSQWFHDPVFVSNIYYARWPAGEIDLVAVDSETQKPNWMVEVKWSDRPIKDPNLVKHVISFWDKHSSVDSCTVTTRTIEGQKSFGPHVVEFLPTSLLIYSVGCNLLRHKKVSALIRPAAVGDSSAKERDKNLVDVS